MVGPRSGTSAALAMRGGATVADGTNNTHVEKDQGWMWWYLALRCDVTARIGSTIFGAVFSACAFFFRGACFVLCFIRLCHRWVAFDLIMFCWTANHFIQRNQEKEKPTSDNGAERNVDKEKVQYALPKMLLLSVVVLTAAWLMAMAMLVLYLETIHQWF